MILFEDRQDAARRLARRLHAYKGRRPLVLGIPRGGVPMARTIADALDGEVDVVLVRKLRAPDQPELALGAVDERGTVVEGTCYDLADDAYRRDEIRRQLELIRRRRQLYAQRAVAIANRLVIIVDDGVATGSSMLAAVRAVRTAGPQRLVVAIGVAPVDALDPLRAEADEVVCLATPPEFLAVGQFFGDFSEVTDDMVVAALTRPRIAAPAGGQV